MRTIRYAGLVAILLLSVEGAVAQKVGTTSMQFLKVMPTARATAMGDAFATLATGADAVFWNPAGLTGSSMIEASTTVTMWLFDTKQGALAASIPFGSYGSIGVQLQYVDFGEIRETRVDQLQFVGTGGNQRYNPGLTGSTFSPSSYLVGLTYARSFTNKFSAGLTLKYARESLYGSSTAVVRNLNDGTTETVNTYAGVVLFDFGMFYNTGFHSIRIGVSLQNFGAQVLFAKEAFPAPLAFRLGTAMDIIGANSLLGGDEENRLTFAYDIFQPNDYAQQMHFGLEYDFGGLIALRAGYKENYDNEGFTYGGGVHTTVADVGVALDYSYAGMGTYLGDAHRISLGVKF